MDFAISFRLDARGLLLLTGSPDFVQVTKKCVHEVLGDIGCAPIAEVVSHSESFLWDPLITVLVTETLPRVGRVCDRARFLPGLLVRRGSLLGGVCGVHIAHTRPTVDCKLSEVAVLWRLGE